MSPRRERFRIAVIAFSTALAVVCSLSFVGVGSAAASTVDAHTVTIAPDGGRLYSGQTGANFSIFSRSSGSDPFSPLSVTNFGSTGGGLCSCQEIAVSSESQFVYSIGNEELHVSKVVPAGIETIESFRHNVGGVSGLAHGRSVALSPDGRDVYVTSENKQIAVFARNTTTGHLSFLEAPTTAGYVGSMAFSPDGSFLYVEDNSSNGRSIDIYARSTSTGRLTYLESPEPGPLGRLAISPDGDFLYVHSEEEITVMSRDPLTGALTFVARSTNGTEGITGMKGGISGLAISPDGEDLYVTSAAESALITFSRDPGTGLLTYVKTQFDGNEGIDGLDGAAQVVVSADGKEVLVAAPQDNGVGIFTRESSSSAPRFRELVTDSSLGSPGAPTSPGSVAGSSPSGGGSTAPAELAFHGDEGVSVDQGARYTDDPDVTLKIVPPGNATGVRISNDGGFATARRFDVAAGDAYPWTLDSSGPERLPKTVYVRFDGPAGESALTFTDDIILDETPPVIEQIAVVEPPAPGPSAAVAQRVESAKLIVHAKDRTSGVSKIQVTTNKSKPGALLPYRVKTSVEPTGKPLFVRVRDKAGNFTRWRKVAAATKAP